MISPPYSPEVLPTLSDNIAFLAPPLLRAGTVGKVVSSRIGGLVVLKMQWCGS
ncbi:hypothetical protein L873DRAFT_1799099 [Choiromyces venosus 120613-1]|uniref:Uncharacterized protein n=1 Tax=Choiromyces venosus 120613-1 TaxID=1336337 RepID=A0A3N4K2C1_9PEZI|nr:hypothetical protein L873DRAFT_1799099 [Choiromyces venosus 120613-1]